jgi:hypothetical protein
MAVAQQSTASSPSAHTISSPHLQQASPGFDPEHVINAHETNLADYLNQPVQDILSRLGLPPLPVPAQLPVGPDGQTPAGAANPVDPTQMIKPATDALGTLGTGQFNNNADPTQMFQGIAQAFESAAEPLGQAVSQLASVWQGAAGSAAGAATTSALADGARVAGQSTSLGQSLSTVATTVSQAEARLIAIINEFIAKIIAIGPSIIFPWGIAQAIQAATEAVTETSEVMTETQGAIGEQAAQVEAVGAPVPMSGAPASLAAVPASMAAAPASLAAAPASLAAAPGIGAASQFLGPTLEMGTSLISPVVEGVGTVTQAAQAGAPGGAGGPADPNDATAAGTAAGNKAALAKAGGGPGSAGALKGDGLHPGLANSQLLPRIPSVPAVGEDGMPVHSGIASGNSAGMGASPMAGGPMGSAARAGAGDGRHNPASFLHTSNDHIVGDLGSAAPPVLGQADPTEPADIDLRI